MNSIPLRNILKDNIYTTYEKTKNFTEIFGQKRKANINSLTASKNTEDPFKEILKVFIPEKDYGKILIKKTLRKIGYESDNNIEPDYFIESLGLIFEFDGPDHYNNPFKIIRDERKYRGLKSIKKNGKSVKIRIIRIPYYFQLTKDVSKFVFKDLINHFSKELDTLPKEGFYSDEKFKNAIGKVYKNMFTGKPVTNELEVPACGLQRSERVPSEYCEKGIEKILNDFKGIEIKAPESIEHQYMWCLKYYIDDVMTYKDHKDNEKLILPTWHKEFMERYEKNISNEKPENLKCIFTRNFKSVLITKNL